LQTKTHAFIPSSAKYGFTHKAWQILVLGSAKEP
jgi:hypothetical protein